MTPEAAALEIVAATTGRLVTLTRQRLDGTLDTLAWRSAMQAELRSAHVAQTALAHGGLGQLTPSARGWVGSELRAQYDYLAGFALDLAQGTVSEAQALARATLYADATLGTYRAAEQRVEAAQGPRECRNVLGAAQHCEECPRLSARGWVPLAEMPAPGRRSCGPRCRCTLEYRPAAVAA